MQRGIIIIPLCWPHLTSPSLERKAENLCPPVYAAENPLKIFYIFFLPIVLLNAGTLNFFLQKFYFTNSFRNFNKYNILYARSQLMNAITYTDLRQNLKTYMDKVIQDNDPLIITRKNKKNVILISVDEYNSLIETNYLLSNEANAEHLKKSIAHHKSGKTKLRELFDE